MKGLGNQIRTLRKTRRLTLMEISKRTGIDQSVLSRIENEAITGTVDSHLKIAQALGVTLPDLYKTALHSQGQPQEDKLKTRLERFSFSHGAVAEMLVGGVLQKKMLPLVLKIKPRGYTQSEELPAYTERFLYGLKGQFEVYIGNERSLLKPGECLYFDGSVPHHLKNTTKAEAWCLSVVTPTSL